MAYNFDETDIENSIIRAIITLSNDFDEDNVISHAGATNPMAYRSQVVPDKMVLVSYLSNSVGSYQVENKTLRPETIKLSVVYFERNLHNQEIYYNKNLIKDKLFNFIAIAGTTDNGQEIKLKMISENRLAFSNEYPDIDGFVWVLESLELYKLI